MTQLEDPKESTEGDGSGEKHRESKEEMEKMSVMEVWSNPLHGQKDRCGRNM